ncbi:MAG: hypothetical protein M1837_005329 [Sclerophora amabilis]|nr:MAG: hypothetical protein M1837_005329 [Sclerophora amabilis]
MEKRSRIGVEEKGEAGVAGDLEEIKRGGGQANAATVHRSVEWSRDVTTKDPPLDLNLTTEQEVTTLKWLNEPGNDLLSGMDPKMETSRLIGWPKGHQDPELSSMDPKQREGILTPLLPKDPITGDLMLDESWTSRIISSPQRSNTAPTEVAKFGDKGSPTRNDDHYRRTHHASGTSKNLTLSSLTKRNTLVPLSIPYTTPASEFLYGTSVVRAALRSGRRKMYKLYVYEGDNREVIDRDLSLRKLARAAGADAIGVSGEWIRLMDKMSKGRPHNGYILEASPLPNLPATGLERITSPSFNFSVTLGHQSREEQAVNGTDNLIPYNNGSKNRFPFVLLLDGILDPGNLGAVLRTSFFLGVDAIAISARNSAPLTPTVLKASAGASEHIPLFSLSSPHNFLSGSSSAGWKIYAAVASSSSTSSPKEQSPIASSRSPKTTTSNTSSTSTNRPPITPYVLLSSLDAPLRHHPCILMLGSEGEGLSPRLRRKADVEVGIECGRSQNGGVDSLNVSVAAALLCQGFLSDVRPIGRAGLMGKKKKKKEQEQIIGEAEQEGETVEEVQGDKLF